MAVFPFTSRDQASIRANTWTSAQARLQTASILFYCSLCSGLMTGCGSVRYLLQAGQGQLSLFTHAQPISEVLKDERTPPRIKSLLGEIPSIKKYGEQNGLTPTANYTEYVKLNRNAAVYVVSACEPLHFKSKEWSFPFVGSFPYLGWFDLASAKQFAEDLRKEGWDVDLRGASAYSTLGWFRDAVLSTMISDGDESLGDLVNVVIHESVHATIYIKTQAFFNESIASFIAHHLTLAYLDQRRGPSSSEKIAYKEAEQRGEKIELRLHEAYEELLKHYSSDEMDSEKLAAKNKILFTLKSDLKFKRDINNATLIQYKTYNSGLEDFEVLFKKCDFNVPRFLTALKKLNPESFSKPQQSELRSVLEPLIQAGCLPIESK